MFPAARFAAHGYSCWRAEAGGGPGAPLGKFRATSKSVYLMP